VNGWVGDVFPIAHSVRQGCPLSALLCILCIEPLAEALRRDKRFSGLRVPPMRREIRLSQYADDLNTVVTSVVSIDITIEWFGYTAEPPCRTQRRQKQRAVARQMEEPIGRPHGFVWATTIKIYRIYFGDQAAAENSTMVLAKLTKATNAQIGRHMTLQSRARYSNTFLCTQLWYVGAHCVLPAATVTAASRVCFRFVWSGKTDRVHRDTTAATPLAGGLGIVHIQTKLDALHLRPHSSSGNHRRHRMANVRHLLDRASPPPHRLFVYAADWHRPPFYARALSAYRRPTQTRPGQPIWKLTTKRAYETLVRYTPPLVVRYPHQGIDYSSTWPSGEGT
jgi:hypothetical protein